jgi:hypothetical protein
MNAGLMTCEQKCHDRLTLLAEPISPNQRNFSAFQPIHAGPSIAVEIYDEE